MIEYIIENWFEILEASGLVVTAAAAIAAMTPTPKDDGVVKFLRKIINVLALNVGKAKNKDD